MWLLLVLLSFCASQQQDVLAVRDACLDAQHRYLLDELFVLMRDIDEIRLLQQVGLQELTVQLGRNGVPWCDAFAGAVRVMARRLKLHLSQLGKNDEAYNRAIARGWFRTQALLEDEVKNRVKCELYESRAVKRHTGLMGEMRRCMERHMTRAKQRFMIDKFAD
jgi:hypothetical protein